MKLSTFPAIILTGYLGAHEAQAMSPEEAEQGVETALVAENCGFTRKGDSLIFAGDDDSAMFEDTVTTNVHSDGIQLKIGACLRAAKTAALHERPVPNCNLMRVPDSNVYIVKCTPVPTPEERAVKVAAESTPDDEYTTFTPDTEKAAASQPLPTGLDTSLDCRHATPARNPAGSSAKSDVVYALSSCSDAGAFLKYMIEQAEAVRGGTASNTSSARRLYTDQYGWGFERARPLQIGTFMETFVLRALVDELPSECRLTSFSSAPPKNPRERNGSWRLPCEDNPNAPCTVTEIFYSCDGSNSSDWRSSAWRVPPKNLTTEACAEIPAQLRKLRETTDEADDGFQSW